jgi:Tfp pilus assembly protein PilO
MVEINTNKNENKYTIIIVGSAIALSIFLVFVVGRPLYLNVVKSGAELKEKQITLERLENKLTALKQLDSKKKELEEKNAVLIAAIPKDKDVSRLFYQFESLARKAGVNIASVTEVTAAAVDVPVQTGTEETITEVLAPAISPISYQVSAKTTSYSNLKKALSNIETALRILSVDVITITEQEGVLNIELTVNTYKRGQ